MKEALKLSEQHLKKLPSIFKDKDNEMSVPYGFTEQDVNLESPKLFMDDLKLKILLQLAEDGLKLMIDHKWLEQPPMASDRNRIAQHS